MAPLRARLGQQYAHDCATRLAARLMTACGFLATLPRQGPDVLAVRAVQLAAGSLPGRQRKDVVALEIKVRSADATAPWYQERRTLRDLCAIYLPWLPVAFVYVLLFEPRKGGARELAAVYSLNAAGLLVQVNGVTNCPTLRPGTKIATDPKRNKRYPLEVQCLPHSQTQNG